MKKKLPALLLVLSLMITLFAGCDTGQETLDPSTDSAITENGQPTAEPGTTAEPIATTAPTDIPEATEAPTPTPAHTHTYTSEVTQEASCSTTGETTYTCTCGDTYKEDIEKISHTESDWIVVTEVTATTDGLQHKVCTICNEELVSEVISSETFVVASGKLDNAPIEWKIVGTTLYVGGKGAIPDFPYSPLQSKLFPDYYAWDNLIAWQPYDELVEKIVIEEGITKLGRSNFDSFEHAKEIVFADSVTEIGKYACNGLGIETIDFNKITTLDFQAFGNLDNLKNLTIPGTIKTISEGCFFACNSPYLTDIYIEEGVKAIGDGAFLVGSGHWDIRIHLPSTIEDFGIANIKEYGAQPVFPWNSTLYVKSGSYAEEFLTEYVAFHKEVWKGDPAYTVIVE